MEHQKGRWWREQETTLIKAREFLRRRLGVRSWGLKCRKQGWWRGKNKKEVVRIINRHWVSPSWWSRGVNGRLELCWNFICLYILFRSGIIQDAPVGPALRTLPISVKMEWIGPSATCKLFPSGTSSAPSNTYVHLSGHKAFWVLTTKGCKKNWH